MNAEHRPAVARRALLLDFDGVLVDSEPIHFASWNGAFEQILGRRVDGSHAVLIGLTLDEIYRLWAGDAAASLTSDVRQQILTLKTELFFKLGAEQLRPTTGSVELLRAAHARGWYTAIVSRSLRRRLFRTLEVMQIPALFDLILGYEDGVDPHTDQKDFAHAARLLRVDPAACVVIEDSASGVRAARQANIGQVIGLTSSIDAPTLQNAGAHYCFSGLDHLLPLFEQIAQDLRNW